MADYLTLVFNGWDYQWHCLELFHCNADLIYMPSGVESKVASSPEESQL